MYTDSKDTTIETLHEIRGIMNRSTRFLSLSGWSGVWAGSTALLGAYIAHGWLQTTDYLFVGSAGFFDNMTLRFVFLAISIFMVALAGGFYFTFRKAKRQEQSLWSNALRQMLTQLFCPIIAGGVFAIVFINHGNMMYIAPACLAFYGLALISASRYTLSDIRYLGMLEVGLGCVCLFFPGYGLYFWAFGFGVLHILYGIFMWNKYDK